MINNIKIKKTNFYFNSIYFEKILEIKRVVKVVKGGKKLSFRAVVVIGDKKNLVGIGIGKSHDVSLAIEKACLSGKKNLITVPITKSYSIPQNIFSHYGASSILLMPANLGTGIIAGGSLRTVLELGGIKNIIGKQFGSSNFLNNARATINALLLIKEKTILNKNFSEKKKIIYHKLLKK